MIIRQAKPDDADAVAPLLVQAMDSLAGFFTANANEEIQKALFRRFFLTPGNQYSYENTLVLENEGTVCGSANGYDGGELLKLRSDFFLYTSEQFGVNLSDIGNETESGELYIDCVSVIPGAQGLGIGTQLINAWIQKAGSAGFERVGLIVEAGNPNARRLYERLGFRLVKQRTFAGGNYEHMQILLD